MQCSRSWRPPLQALLTAAASEGPHRHVGALPHICEEKGTCTGGDSAVFTTVLTFAACDLGAVVIGLWLLASRRRHRSPAMETVGAVLAWVCCSWGWPPSRAWPSSIVPWVWGSGPWSSSSAWAMPSWATG